jgi:hypothetical protein
MKSFQNWLAVSPLASAGRVFLAILVTLAVADWVATGSIDFSAWQTWTIAAISAAIPTVIRWLNPEDIEFGRGSWTTDPFDVFADDEDDY